MMLKLEMLAKAYLNMRYANESNKTNNHEYV